ncbi:hypothetical protein ACC754_41200, partial [Rhizobium johnstonii]
RPVDGRSRGNFRRLDGEIRRQDERHRGAQGKLFHFHLLHKAVPGCTLLTPEIQAFALKPQFPATPLPRRSAKRNKQTVKSVLR